MSAVSTHQHIPNLTQNNHPPIIRNEEQPWHSRTGQHARYHWSLVSNTYKLRFTQGLFIASLHWPLVPGLAHQKDSGPRLMGRVRGNKTPSVPGLSPFFSSVLDQELQMISWQFYTVFKAVMFYRLIYYDTLLRIQLWIRDVSWG